MRYIATIDRVCLYIVFQSHCPPHDGSMLLINPPVGGYPISITKKGAYLIGRYLNGQCVNGHHFERTLI